MKNLGKKIEKYSQNKTLQLILVILVLLFTFLLRAIHSDRVPNYSHMEEHLFGWSGMYLIQEGVPVSWSTLSYDKDKIIYSGPITDQYNHAVAHVDLIKPWLDEPPLYSLIVGGSAIAFGADRHFIIPSSFMRFPMLLFGLGTSVVLFILTRKLFDYWTALIATLLFGTIPIFVFGSRMAVPENVISLLFILTIYLYILFKEKPTTWLFGLLMIIPGIAGLMKPTGFFIAPLIAFFFFQRKD
jgi:hypothetical protein